MLSSRTQTSYCQAHKCVKKVTKPSVPPSNNQKRNPLTFRMNPIECTMENTSTYKRDFQAWKVSKRQPFKLIDTWKVSDGWVVPNSATRDNRALTSQAKLAAKPTAEPEVQERPLIASVTSYRSDYIPHPVQPRVSQKNPAWQPTLDQIFVTSARSRPKMTCETNQECCEDHSDFFEQFKMWSLDTNIHDQGDDTAHECQDTKAVQQSVETETTTAMKEDYRAWDNPRHHKKPDRPKKTTFSECTLKPSENCKPKPRPPSPHPERPATAVCNSSCQATDKPHGETVEVSTFESVSNKTGETRRYWSTTGSGGVTLSRGDIHKEPCKTKQTSCTVPRTD